MLVSDYLVMVWLLEYKIKLSGFKIPQYLYDSSKFTHNLPNFLME